MHNHCERGCLGAPTIYGRRDLTGRVAFAAVELIRIEAQATAPNRRGEAGFTECVLSLIIKIMMDYIYGAPFS